jgi:hypothetical protein
MAKEFAGSTELEQRRRAYLIALLAGWPNSPAFGDDGVIEAAARSSLERFHAAHSRTESGRIVGRYLALLRSANWRRTAAVDVFIQRLTP